MAEFSLIEEPWIPCIDLDGRNVEHGIRDTLLNAHKLHEICDDSPLVTVAIHRMLLAILYRAFRGPPDTRQWKGLYEAGSFASNSHLDGYLIECHDRFFLFDGVHPFMQVADLDLNEYKNDGELEKDKTDGLMRLAREAPDKGGRILFDHRVGTERLAYQHKHIARMIISAQSFAGTGVASAGKVGDQEIKPSPCQFAPCVEGLCLWLQGDNLFQTLMLNLVPGKVNSSDLPAWENDHLVESASRSWIIPVSFTGPIQRFAPASRFIRVVDEKSLFFTNGLKTAPDSEDPMMAYTRESSDKPYVAIKLREHKSAWRDAHALFAIAATNRKPPESLNLATRLVREGVINAATSYRANVVGLATKPGKGLLWRHERMPVPSHLLANTDLSERLAILIGEAEAVGSHLSRGFWNSPTGKTIRNEPMGRIEQIADLMLTPALQVLTPGIVRKEGGQLPDDAHNKASLDLSKDLNPSPAYWARMEEHFFRLLENIPRDWDEAHGDWRPDDMQAAAHEWRENVKREANRALEESIRSLGTTARAIQAVARVRTDFGDEDLKSPSHKVDNGTRGKAKGGKKK